MDRKSCDHPDVITICPDAMKPFVYALLGAMLFAVLAYGLVDAFAHWYRPRFIQSDSDIGEAHMWSLVFLLCCTIAGGILGFRRARRSRH